MNFTFKMGLKIKEAWVLWKTVFVNMFLLFVASFVIQWVISMMSKNDYSLQSIIVSLISIVINVIISFIWIKVSLEAVDGKGFEPFKKENIPNLSKIWNFIKTAILVFLCVLAGFILLIIPAFYVSSRLLPAMYLSVEKSQGARQNIKEAWEKTRGNGWKIFWKSFLMALFGLLGFLLLIVGAFVTVPMFILLKAMLYREIMKIGNVTSNQDSVREAEVIKEEVREEPMQNLGQVN